MPRTQGFLITAAPVAMLALAIASVVVHVLAATHGGSWWFVALAAACCASALTACMSARSRDLMLMGLASACMVSVHALLAQQQDHDESTTSHLLRHLSGRGFDLAHVGFILAALDWMICLYLMTYRTRRRRSRGRIAS
ncbi:MAG: hypothetical protein AB7I40_14310 [Nocardioides sp.]|uniref:hypothetical protein n=1 Tax=Nocardioides sp. TaxID=35761 RepID=UPI003D13295E